MHVMHGLGRSEATNETNEEGALSITFHMIDKPGTRQSARAVAYLNAGSLFVLSESRLSCPSICKIPYR